MRLFNLAPNCLNLDLDRKSLNINIRFVHSISKLTMVQIFKKIWWDFTFRTIFSQTMTLMVFKWLIWTFKTKSNLFFLITHRLPRVTGGFLVVTSGYLIAATGYFWFFLVTSGYYSLLLIPRFGNNVIRNKSNNIGYIQQKKWQTSYSQIKIYFLKLGA